MRDGLRFGLLGPPVLYGTDGDVTPVGGGKLRALLVALLLEPGRVVPLDVIEDALWSGAPPASARASMQNHVTRLRRLLDCPRRLRAVAPGYLLRVDDGELDVHVFERRLTAARAAHTRREWALVRREADAALALWRGTPLSGLPPGIGGHALVPRLEEARLQLLEWRYDAELHLAGAAGRVGAQPGTSARTGAGAVVESGEPGRRAAAGQVVSLGALDGAGPRLIRLAPELAALVAEYPLREPFHRLLMLVLHRTGRQAEALAVHRDLRARLIEELGIEPGPAVREAHLEILRGGGTGPGEPAVGPVSSEECAGCQGAESPEGTGPAPLAGVATDAASGPVAEATADAAMDAASGPVAGATADATADAVQDTVPDAMAGARVEESARAVPDAAAALVRLPDTVLPRPAQLPPAPAHFIGRAGIIEELRRALGRSRGTAALAVLSGMAGVGKSALALHVAHALRKRFPDGQLYVNLHGATPGMTPLSPGQALASLLRDLGTEPRHIPEHPDAAAALLRSVLAPTRTLMVLDDAAHAAQVRPLLPAGAGCAVIVTSRSPLTALDGALRLPLAPLSDEESAELLRTVSGRAAGLDGTHPLVELTGRLPLALRIVAARLAARRALTPAALAGQLAATEGRLHHFEYDDLSVRRSLAVAHDALRSSDREADRDAALALRRIGAVDLPEYGVALLARLIGTDERRAEAALDRLVDVALLEETAYGRYAPHDLVRDFAREIAGVTAAGGGDRDPREKGGLRAPEAPGAGAGAGAGAESGDAADDVDAVERALRWYAGVAARSLAAIVEPGLDLDDRSRPTASQPPAHTADVEATPPFSCAKDAFAWGDLELENVVALVERYAESSPYVLVLARLLHPYVQRSGRVAELEVIQCAALAAARRLGDEAAEAYALGDLAGLHFMTGRTGDALALNDRALAVWRRLGVLSRVRRGLNNRGMLLEGLGRYAESGDALLQSLELSRTPGDPHTEAVTYSHLGNLYEHTDPRAAIDQHRRSLVIGDALGDVIVRHSAHCNIGYAHLRLGEPWSAVPHFEESLRILDGHGDWHGESQTRLGLVRALRRLGRVERAVHECDVLFLRADQRADRFTQGLARHQRGLLLRADGRLEEAYRQWELALEALRGRDTPVVGELRDLLREG